MKIYKLLLVIVMTVLSVSGLKAQTYADTIRSNSWTMYVAGGVSSYFNLRNNSNAAVQAVIEPDINFGLKYNINPGARVGLNFGYTKLKSKIDTIANTQTVIPHYQIGSYDDATLTIDKAVLVNRADNHFAGVDMTLELNLLEFIQKRNERWNLWLGFGAGYYHGWNRQTITTAVREEAVANGNDHFNVYNNDYITTESVFSHVNTLYLPVRLSLEVDISPRLTLGVMGEYRFMPLDKIYTPKGMWSGGVSLAYNFVAKRYSKQTISERYERIISHLNKDINDLKGEVSDLNKKNKAITEAKKQQEKEAEAIKGVEDARKRREELQEKEQVMVQDIAISKSRAEQVSDIADLAHILLDNPFSKIYIVGYSSVDGRKEYSKKLSALRADDIANILIKRFNINPKRIVVNGEVPAGGTYKVYEYRNLASLVIDFGR